MSVDVGSAVGYLDLDISGFLKGLKSAQDEANKSNSKIGSSLSKVGKSFTSAGTTLTKGLTVPLMGVGAAGLKVASDFEKGMSNVKAISGATGQQFIDLKDKAVELGASTAFSASEVADAMTEMAKAGWNADQIIDGMSGVLSAAAASGEGLASVSTIVADTITGFGLAASDSTKIADLLTQAANSGTIGITDLGESFKYIAPVAGAMGLSVEDVTTAISAMSMASIKGSAAGTSLRTMLTNLVKPTDAIASAMSTLGIEVTNSDGSMKSLDEIISILRNSFSGLTDEEKAMYAATLAGKEGMSGLLSILNLTEEEYNEIATSMDNAGGVAEETAAIMQDNLQSKTEQLFGALESLAIVLGDLLIPHLQTFVVWLTSMVEKFTALDPETQKTILTFAGLAIVIGPLLGLFGKLTSGVGGIVTSLSNLITKGGLAKPALAGLGDTSEKASKGVNSGAASFGNLAGQALKLVAVGASFVMIGAGIKMIANSAIDIANAGPGAAAAFALLIAGGVGLTVAIAAIGATSTATAPGLLALGAAVALVSAGIALLVKAIGTTVSKIIDSIGNSSVKAGDGFTKLSNAILNLVNNTKLSDLIRTFAAVEKGIKNVNKAADDTDKAAKNITKFANSAKTDMDKVKSSITSLEKAFDNADLSFNQHIKLPHFYMYGSFDAQSGSVPSVGVSWYKKAMSAGMILNSPTIFGYDPRTGRFLGGGEAGSETVVGTSSLMKMIRQAVNDAIKPMAAATYQLARASVELGYITYDGFIKQQQMFNDKDRKNPTNSNGDTFNFYSPKPIDEIEAAKQLKKTKRELAEGF